MKDSNELSAFEGALSKAIADSLPEIGFEDLGNAFNPIQKATAAIEDVGKVGGQYAAATPELRDEDKEIFEREIGSSIEPNLTDLLARSQDGVKAIWAIAVLATTKSLAAKLNDPDYVGPASGHTSDSLLALIAEGSK